MNRIARDLLLSSALTLGLAALPFAAVRAQDELPQECIDMGASSFDECQAMLSPPVEEPLPEPEQYVEPEPEAEPYVEPEPEQYVEPEPEPEPYVEPEPQPEPEPFVEPEPEPQAEPAFEPDPESESEPFAEPEPQTEQDPFVEPEPQAELEPVVEPESQPEPDPSVEPQSEAEIDPALGPEEPSEESEADPSQTEFPDPTADQLPGEEPSLVDPATNEPPVEVIEESDTELAPEDIAPLYDSAKEGETYDETTEPDGPAPETDQDAQAYEPPAEFRSLADEQGEPLPEAPTFAPEAIEGDTNITVNIVEETNNTYIYEVNNTVIINNPVEQRDLLVLDGDTYDYQRLPDGLYREVIYRPDGSSVVTERDRWGNIIRRSRFDAEGYEYVLVYFDFSGNFGFNYFTVTDDELRRMGRLPYVKDYYLYYDNAELVDIELFFRRPPIEQVRRTYTIDDVRYKARIRDMARRLDVGGITFETGSARLDPKTYKALDKLANAILALLEDNPSEMFLIEGHTDAVGPAIENLKLSNARATEIVRVLSRYYDVPPENLVAQGYGEQYLKVKTSGPEKANRRVAVRRITPLVAPTRWE